MILGQRLRRPADSLAGRYTLVLSGVVIGWLLLAVGAAYIAIIQQDAAVILPPLERFATVISILLLGWGFIFAGDDVYNRTPLALLALAILVSVAGYTFTALEWSELARQVDFNLSAYGMSWTFAAAALSMLGIVLLLLRFDSVIDAPIKIVFFVVLFAGFGWTLWQMAQGNIIGDYAGPPRLAFAIAIVILPSIIYRAIIRQMEGELRQTAALQQAPLAPESPTVRPPQDALHTIQSPVERESVQLLRALGLILEDATASSVPERIVKSVLDTMKADVVALLRLQDANYADVALGYDRVLSRTIDGISINLDNQPTLVNALERRAQRMLSVDNNAEELQDLYARLDIEQVGPAYLQPMARKGEVIAVLIVALPYTSRELLPAEQELLKGVAVIAASLLALSDAADDARMQAEERAIQSIVHGLPVAHIETQESQTLATGDETNQELADSLRLAREQIAELNQQVVQLKLELDDERTRIAAGIDDTEEGMSISQRIIALTEAQQQLRVERDQLLERVQEAEAALQGAVGTNDETRMDDLVEALQREKDNLSREKESLQEQLEEIRREAEDGRTAEMETLLTRMSEEKSRLEVERDQFSTKLEEMQSQLSALGIEEGPSGFVQLVNQLSEQRTLLQTQNAALKKERDNLLAERAQLAQRIEQEEERETRLIALGKELRNLAGDREAAAKHQEKLRAERDDLLSRLNVVKEEHTRLLTQNTQYEAELKEAHSAEANLNVRIQTLLDERSDLQRVHDRLLAEKSALENERDQLIARVEGDRGRLQELGVNGVGALTTMIDDLTAQRNQLEHELHQSQATIASLENELEALQVRANQGAKFEARYRPNDPELLMGLVQELRTPMTSITGYVDLLLGESAGILGEMQRKFLQRVSTNVLRLASMLDDLVHVTELDTGSFKLEPGPVNVVDLIEDAITNASIQFREKGLAVNLDLGDDLPEVDLDKDAISQIIGQLLTNAYLVSPPNSEISVNANRQQMILNRPETDDEYMADCLFISIEDRGGGIAAEDHPRVFARKYKAENPLIQGLGDTGVGLSIAKALAEAHGGRLWLESKENIGSILSVALPIDNVESTTAEGNLNDGERT